MILQLEEKEPQSSEDPNLFRLKPAETAATGHWAQVGYASIAASSFSPWWRMGWGDAEREDSDQLRNKGTR